MVFYKVERMVVKRQVGKESCEALSGKGSGNGSKISNHAFV